ncbi:MAG TPA: S9 family peptidase [Vicinamibacteria bacterium]|nr:S9 family peptidase [Vicinamibacteria bacterium]
MLRKIVFFAMISAAAVEAQVAPRAIELDDYYRFESADEPAISPDGRFVAFTRHYIVEEDNRRRSEIWLAPSDGSEPGRRITVPAFDASAPRFSPDGKLLMFRSKRDGETSTWFLRTDRLGEAFQIAGVDGPALVSPDGRLIAFTKETQPEKPAPTASTLEKELAERFEGQIYDWMQFRYDGRGYLSDPANPYSSPPRELYVVSTEGGEPQRLTSIGVDVLDFSWSADGRRLVFTADAHQRDEYVYERADLWLVDLGGDVRRVTDDGFHHSSPRFSPDGSRIAYRRVKGLSLVIAEKAKSGAPVDVYVMHLESGETTNVTESWDLRPGEPFWSADGGLYFDAGVGGNQHLFRVSAIEPGAVQQMTEGDRWLSDFSFTPDGRRMAFAGETATSPSDVYVAAADGSSETKLSRFGETYASGLGLSAPERIAFPSRDGTEIEGWVLLPAGYRPDTRRPLILSIHGGPHGAYGNRFNFQFQLWATAGYVVLYTNPRGSSGYGEEFLFATWGGGWGNLDTEDVLAGVDTVRSRYAIDEGRMGVTGYSYGGFLTNWVITHDTRFAAAIVGAGISNWISDYGTADIPRTKESEFYGPPWEDEGGTLLQRQSPIRYVQNVVTPTLFVHGESDYRVPIEQGEQMYTALKKRRVPARFIRYPDSYHGGWTPWNVVHRYHHELEWWKEHLTAPSGTSQ